MKIQYYGVEYPASYDDILGLAISKKIGKDEFSTLVLPAEEHIENINVDLTIEDWKEIKKLLKVRFKRLNKLIVPAGIPTDRDFAAIAERNEILTLAYKLCIDLYD